MTAKLVKYICVYSIVILLGEAACAQIRYDHDLTGMVIDNQTGEPITGTVVLAQWEKYYNTPAGSHIQYHDAKETLADENGGFFIQGKGLSLFTFVQTSTAYVFKAGYKWMFIDYKKLRDSGGVVRLQKAKKGVMRI